MTRTVQLDDTRIELSRPLADRPDVIVVMTDDGRRAILGDGREFVMAGDLEALWEAMNTRGRERERADKCPLGSVTPARKVAAYDGQMESGRRELSIVVSLSAMGCGAAATVGKASVLPVPAPRWSAHPSERC